MKRMIAALLALMLMLGVSAAMADGMTFQGLAWGLSPNQIDGQLGASVSWTPYMMPYTATSVYTGTVNQYAAYTDHQINGGLMGTGVTTLYGMTAVFSPYCMWTLNEDGLVDRTSVNARLYQVRCTLVVSDVRTAYNNLKATLNAAFGDGTVDFEGDPRSTPTSAALPIDMSVTSWTDGETQVSLSMAIYDDKYQQLNSLSLTYAQVGSGAALDALREELIVEDQIMNANLAKVSAWAQAGDISLAMRGLKYLCGYGITK